MRIFFVILSCFFSLSLQAQTRLAGIEAEADVLTRDLNRLIESQLPQSSNVGIMVYDLTDNKTYYEYLPKTLARPASAMKLLTSITALSLPLRDEPFRTELWYDGEVRKDTLFGNIYVRGGFDPEFNTSSLQAFADSIAALQVKVIAGTLYGDVSLKDSLYWGSGWLWDDNPEGFQPYLSPLMFHKGVVTIEASPGNKGEMPNIRPTPFSTYYTVENDAVSNQSDAGRFKVTRNWMQNENRIMVSGNVTGRLTRDVNVYDSGAFFMHTLNDLLQQRGVYAVGGYGFAEMKAEGGELITVWETPMQQVLEQMMKESDNLNAEAMLYRIAAQSTGKRHLTASDGTDVIKELIRQTGLNPDNYRIADGCGLSNYDYISPELLVAFLRLAYTDKEIYQRLYTALPIGGVDGTLKSRMRRGTPSFNVVHAKTGSYTAVNTLAGYLKTQEGHELAFAIMNQSVLSAQVARNFQDKFCDMLITRKRQ